MHPRGSLDCYVAGYPLIESKMFLPLTGPVVGLSLGIFYKHLFMFNFFKAKVMGEVDRRGAKRIRKCHMGTSIFFMLLLNVFTYFCFKDLKWIIVRRSIGLFCFDDFIDVVLSF